MVKKWWSGKHVNSDEHNEREELKLIRFWFPLQIKVSSKYLIQTTGLLIKNVEESDDGVYICRAAVYDTGELIERPIRVEVQVLPKIQPFNVDLEGVEDQPFSVQCNATGKPAPSYTWVKDSEQKNLAEQGDR